MYEGILKPYPIVVNSPNARRTIISNLLYCTKSRELSNVLSFASFL
jgi:hypothetical protein